MNRFTIENKNKFCRYFLEPLAKLNPRCILVIEKDKIRAKSAYPDKTLFLEATTSIETDILDEKDVKELAFVDLTRFIKTLDFIQKDVVSLKLDKNFISYKDSANHFVMQLYDSKIVTLPKLNFEQVHKMDFELDLDLDVSIFFEIIKAGGVYPDLNKLYLDFANNTLKIELTDKLKSCCDGFTPTIENISTGDVCTDFVLPLDALRIILTNKVEKIKFRYHKQKPLVNLLYDIDGIHMSYVVPCINK